MQDIQWLFMANVAVWLGIGAYVAFLAKAQKDISKRLALKERMDNV